MKVNIENPVPIFQPKTLTVTFETKEELEVFRKLMSMDCRVPSLAVRQGEIKQDQESKLSNMMYAVFSVMHSI
jgi:hypothetical protein